MGLILLIAIIAVVAYVVHKNNEQGGANNTKHKKSSYSTIPSAPAKKFDENNPYEIYKIAHALSYIAAIAGDSHVHAVLQDEDCAKNWPRCMRISASIDDCISSRKEWIPSDVILYLQSVPFKVSRTSSDYHLEYTFEKTPLTPSELKYGVIDEMKKGASKSTFVINGLHQFTVRDSGFIALDVDD